MLMGTGPSCTEVVDGVKVRESRRSTGKSDTVCDIRSDSGSISGAKVGTDMNQFFFYQPQLYPPPKLSHTTCMSLQ